MNRLRALARKSRRATTKAALTELWLRRIKSTPVCPEVRRVLADRMKESSDE